MLEETLVYRTCRDPRWLVPIEYLMQLLGCSRYSAARLIVAGIREGYLR